MAYLIHATVEQPLTKSHCNAGDILLVYIDRNQKGAKERENIKKKEEMAVVPNGPCTV
jgi:hypothetical protein